MTKVEEFLDHEVGNEHPECSDEAIALIKELGLEGQSDLISRATDDGLATRSPYREITKEEDFVYRTLLPARTLASSYKAEPIPLRVLQIMAHASALGIFHKFEIWHREGVATKDPVLVGYIKESDRSWADGTCYILARWGEVLEAFPVLLKKANEIAREVRLGKLKRIELQVRADIEATKSCSSFVGRTDPNAWGFLD